MRDDIEHKGTVLQIKENLVVVRILSSSSCASCHAKGACSTMDSKEKDIEVRTNDFGRYSIGEEVVVSLEPKLGFKAVLLGFLIPFFVVLLCVILCNMIFANDGVSAVLGLISAAIYYYIIYLFRDNIDREFRFKIRK